MSSDAAAVPSKIIIHQRSKKVTIQYNASSQQKKVIAYPLTGEYLRVHSPSAEVQQHGNPILLAGKKDVGITDATIVGLYGVKFQFDDGHNTGIYTWTYLESLCTNEKENWRTYIDKLHQAGKTREGNASVVKFMQ